MKIKMKIIILAILSLILVAVLSFFIYTAQYYRAEPEALAILEEDDSLITDENYFVLPAAKPGDTALLFYPGAKVEETAYLPILDQIRQKGITCILVKMPFHMAIFDKDAADFVMAKFPEITNWYIGGHSMGGAMASSYASDHQDKIKGLVLLGAYLYGTYPSKQALTVYGSLNESVEEKITYTDNIVVIEGGNHAQFGNYGKQKGDKDAEISTEEQQKQAVEAIAGFMGLG